MGACGPQLDLLVPSASLSWMGNGSRQHQVVLKPTACLSRDKATLLLKSEFASNDLRPQIRFLVYGFVKSETAHE